MIKVCFNLQCPSSDRDELGGLKGNMNKTNSLLLLLSVYVRDTVTTALSWALWCKGFLLEIYSQAIAGRQKEYNSSVRKKNVGTNVDSF